MPASAEPLPPTHTASRSLEALGHLIDALSGRRMNLQWLTADKPGTEHTRPILRTDKLLLPVNTDDELRLAAIAHAAAHLLYSPAAQAVGKLKPMGIAMASTIEDARVERLLIARYPGLRAPLLRQARLACLQPQGPEGSFPDLIARLHLALLDPSHQDDGYWVSKGRGLFEAQVARLNDPATFRGVASVLANDLGQMRVRMNLQGYAVPYAHGDDNSFLWLFEQTGEQATTSVDTPSASAGSRSTQTAPPQEIILARYPYPEWDYRLERQRERWSTVVERGDPSPPGPPAATGLRTGHARQRVTQLDHRVRLRRQWEGEDIDLDAATELMIDRRIGVPPEPRVHRRSGRSPRRRSLLLLLDLSTSANDVIDADGTTVLDLEREAAIALQANAIENGDRVAVHGFSSNTREQVDYLRLSEFGMDDPGRLEQTLRGVHARHSTRMGAAIRHALTCMRDERDGSRHLVLLSDGEASDIDVFDDAYLREDAAAAVREARKAGIHVFCLALDSQAGDALCRVFGHGNYRTVLRPAALPRALTQVHEQLGRR